MPRVCQRELMAFLATLILMTASCSGEPESVTPFPTFTPYPPDLYIGLSDSAAPLADLVRPAYVGASGRSAPVFLPGNDQALLGDLQEGVLEAALVYNLPAGSDFWFSPVALDGVVIVANPDLGLENLTGGQLQAILGGSIDNWAEISGRDLSVALLSREAGSGTWEILRQRVMQNSRLSGSARIVASDEVLMQEVIATPGAIGFATMGNAGDSAIRFEGHKATPETVADQSYPLTTPIYFVTLTEPQGSMRDFLAWLQSTGGQSALGEKYGQVR